MYQKQLALIAALYLVLGSWKGYIALFQEGDAEPWQIFPKKVELMPQADQEALQEGILIRNDRDLNRLMEDYLS